MKTFEELVNELCVEKKMLSHTKYPLANYDLFKEVFEKYINQQGSINTNVVRPVSASASDGELLQGEGVAKAVCGDCGKLLTLVRPGSHQCDNRKCPSNKRAELL